MKEPSAIQATAAFFGLPKHVVDVLGEPAIKEGVELYLKAQSEIANLKEKLEAAEKERDELKQDVYKYLSLDHALMDRYRVALERIADISSAINEGKSRSYADYELRAIAREALGAKVSDE